MATVHMTFRTDVKKSTASFCGRVLYVLGSRGQIEADCLSEIIGLSLASGYGVRRPSSLMYSI